MQRRLPIEDNDVIVAHVSLDNVPILEVVIGIACVVPQIDALAVGTDDVARAGVDLGSVGYEFAHLVNVVPSPMRRSTSGEGARGCQSWQQLEEAGCA